MSKLNLQIFHDFFYYMSENPRRYEVAKSANSYSGRHFFSYSTEIGYWHAAGDRDVLFISKYSFSNTTAGHISALRRACPFSSSDIIFVPFEYDDNFSGPGMQSADFFATMRGRFIEKLSKYTAADVKYAARRRELIETYENYAAFHVAAGYTAEECAGLHGIVELAELAREIEDARGKKKSEKLAEYAKKAIERAAAIDAALKDTPVFDIARSVFGNGEKLQPEIKRARKEYLAAAFPGASFIWKTAAGDIETSQGVHFETATAKTLYKLFQAGKIKIDMHIGPFTLREITAEYVQIGCHKIPLQNIHEVCASL